MPDEPTGDNGATGSEGGTPSGSEAPAKTYSQEDFDKLAAQERERGRKSTEKALLEALGVSDIESAKAVLEKARAEEESRKSDLQKAQEAQQRLEQELAAERAQRVNVLVSSKLEGALRDAGCSAARIGMALKLIDRDAVTVENGEVKGAAEAVSLLKEASPEWFGGAASGSAPAVTTGTGSTASTSENYRDDPAARRKVLQEKYGISLP